MRSDLVLLLLLLTGARSAYLRGFSTTIHFTSQWAMSLPTFKSQVELNSSPKWSKYLRRVYGPDLVDVSYPLDLQTFQFFYIQYLEEAGFADYPKQHELTKRRVWSNNTYIDDSIKAGDVLNDFLCCLDVKHIFVYLPSHQPIRNNAKVEVMHGLCSTHEERFYWMYVLRGTGIFYDVGQTLALPTHPPGPGKGPGTLPVDLSHEAKDSFDSVHYFNYKEHGIYKYEIVDLRLINKTMKNACPLVSSPFFSAGKPCKCDPTHMSHALNCMG